MPRIQAHGAGRISAAMVGAPAAALLVILALAAGLPMDSGARLVVAELAAFPLVVAGSCAALLSRSGARAWAGCALVAALALAVLMLVR